MITTTSQLERRIRRNATKPIMGAFTSAVLMLALAAAGESLPGFMRIAKMPMPQNIAQAANPERWPKHAKKAKQAKPAAPRPHGIEKVEQCPEDQACEISAPDEYQPPAQ